MTSPVPAFSALGWMPANVADANQTDPWAELTGYADLERNQIETQPPTYGSTASATPVNEFGDPSSDAFSNNNRANLDLDYQRSLQGGAGIQGVPPTSNYQLDHANMAGTWRSSPLPSLTERDTRSPSSGPDTPRSAAPVSLDGMYTGAGPSYAANHTALADLGFAPTAAANVNFDSDAALGSGAYSLGNILSLQLPGQEQFGQEDPFELAGNTSHGSIQPLPYPPLPGFFNVPPPFFAKEVAINPALLLPEPSQTNANRASGAHRHNDTRARPRHEPYPFQAAHSGADLNAINTESTNAALAGGAQASDAGGSASSRRRSAKTKASPSATSAAPAKQRKATRTNTPRTAKPRATRAKELPPRDQNKKWCSKIALSPGVEAAIELMYRNQRDSFVSQVCLVDGCVPTRNVVWVDNVPVLDNKSIAVPKFANKAVRDRHLRSGHLGHGILCGFQGCNYRARLDALKRHEGNLSNHLPTDARRAEGGGEVADDASPFDSREHDSDDGDDFDDMGAMGHWEQSQAGPSSAAY